MKQYRHYKFNPFITDAETVLYQAERGERFIGNIPFDVYTWVAVFESEVDDAVNGLVPPDSDTKPDSSNKPTEAQKGTL